MALRLATPAYLLRLWRRGTAEPGYRSHLGERLGLYGDRTRPAAGAIWVHAVSLGETRAAQPLVEALRAAHPGRALLLTHGTATGREAGAALLQAVAGRVGAHADDRQAWLPYDTPGAVRRFLRWQRPSVGVLMETELWPALMHAAERQGLPVVLANARLSARSARKGERLRALLHPAAARLSRVLAQTAADAQRLRAAGARDVQVAGNLKYDLDPPPALLALGRHWRDAIAAPRPVVLAASTREGEEAPLLAAWQAALRARPAAAPRPLLLLVPRHPQRFDEVAALVRQQGLTLERRSAWKPTPSAVPAEPSAAIAQPLRDVLAERGQPPAEALAADVWLGDSLGEMPLYYASAQAALLGGSFAPLGGQNLIEAAACGCPLVMGPHTFNFEQAAEDSLAAGASQRVDGIEAGVAAALALAVAADRPSWEARARDFAAAHRGAARRMAAAIVPGAAGAV
ncbi:3-deoxy-D-manno-octulosonic acid transferase [Pseudaquabacterium rugosum]|uniref:3-deoxy-D-manno-octulosonic acid transferase n=1 Tax=Pseudaquabacterium rugosum TaxID=2984194 RepID=A0ABU9B8I9_9BURK